MAPLKAKPKLLSAFSIPENYVGNCTIWNRELLECSRGAALD